MELFSAIKNPHSGLGETKGKSVKESFANIKNQLPSRIQAGKTYINQRKMKANQNIALVDTSVAATKDAINKLDKKTR